MRFFKFSFLALLLVLPMLFLAGNKTPVQINEEEWKEVVDGADYTENYKEKDKEEEKTNNNNQEFTELKPLNYDLSGLKYVFYFLVVGLVLFVIIKIVVNLNKNPTVKKIKISHESIEEIEEKMHEIDLEQLLQEAIVAKNYRVALRINFLIIIKLLSQRGNIIWAKEKTNWEYHSEVKNEVIANHFKEIIIGFEPIWYGEHLLIKDQYELLSPSYESLKKQLTPDE